MDTEITNQKILRLVRISKENPLLPKDYIPWEKEASDMEIYMPWFMVSLEGHDLWYSLSYEQQRELGRLEMIQVMYSYAWSESLANFFFTRHLLSLSPGTTEYQFLLREIIEECRHQEMFDQCIEKLGRKPVMPPKKHQRFATFCLRLLNPQILFMSVLSIELMADVYAKHIRKDKKVYQVLRKVSELHHIEEGRHIFYTKLWLERYTQSANYWQRCIYSITVLTNIIFLKSLYIQEAFFKQLGVVSSKKYTKAAKENFNSKFVHFALSETLSFVHSFNGFNRITRPLWKKFLKVPYHKMNKS